MLDFLRDIFGRYTPLWVLGGIAVAAILMAIFGLNFGWKP